MVLLPACPFRSGYGVKAIDDLEGVTTIGNDWRPGPGGFEREFMGIMEAAKEIYPYFAKKGVDPDGLEAEFLSRVSSLGAGAVAADFLPLMQELFACLGNGHSGIVNLEWSAADARAVRLADGVFVDRFSGGLGPARGDEILAIDGQHALDWIDRRVVRASTEQGRRQSAVEEIFTRWFYEPGLRAYRFKRPDGSEYEAELDLSGAGDATTIVGVDARTIGESGYIAINAMRLGLEDIFVDRLTELLDRPSLVIDLRANEGGDSRVGERIMPHLLQNFYVSCLGNGLWPDCGMSYRGKVAFLIGPNTFSAAESFACDLQRSERAIAVGTATGGDLGSSPSLFLTEGGICFVLATDGSTGWGGVNIEGIGVLPDVEVEASAEVWLAGRDAVLEGVLEELEEP